MTTHTHPIDIPGVARHRARPHRSQPVRNVHAYLPPHVASPPGADRVSFVLVDRWDDRCDRFAQRCAGADHVLRIAGAGIEPAPIGMALVDQAAEVLATAWLAPAPTGAGELALAVRDDYRFRGLGGGLLDIGVRHARLLGLPCVHGDVSADRAKALSLLRSRGSVRPVPGDAGQTVCLRLDPAADCQAGPRQRSAR